MALNPPIVATHATPAAVAEMLAPLRNDFSVAIWTPGNPYAVGAIIRVAHNFLAREIFLVGKDTFYAKASMGMHKYETLVRVPDEEDLFDAINGRPLWAVEKDHSRRSVHSVAQFPPRVVFVFGSERFGLPQGLLARADEVIGIPVYGVNHCLPLAVAAGIVMSEWARRHYADGVTF
jgi:tRNA G18 (ribose-2'-O)-methylase SpoU